MVMPVTPNTVTPRGYIEFGYAGYAPNPNPNPGAQQQTPNPNLVLWCGLLTLTGRLAANPSAAY